MEFVRGVLSEPWSRLGTSWNSMVLYVNLRGMLWFGVDLYVHLRGMLWFAVNQIRFFFKN